MEKCSRTILHLDLDAFFVSVERLKNSKLNNKPVIIGGSDNRGVVSSCSYEARMCGVHSAMPTKMARRLCPGAHFITGNMQDYAYYSAMVTDIIAEKSPLFQKASIDEFYIDLSGMDRFYNAHKWSSELRQYIIYNTGLPISFGLSVNKCMAKMATNEAKPNGELYVPAKDVQSFLDPLSIRKIPGLGKQTYAILQNIGIEYIKTLRNISPETLEQILGKNGRYLWKRAHGIDHSQVKSSYQRKSIGSEHTFSINIKDVETVKNLLILKTEKLCYKLRKEFLVTSQLAVKIRYANFKTYSLQKQIPYSSFDHELIPEVMNLFNQLYNKQMYIRLVGVRFGGLAKESQQLNLFNNSQKMIKLYGALDDIRKQYGSKSVKRATSITL